MSEQHDVEAAGGDLPAASTPDLVPARVGGYTVSELVRVAQLVSKAVTLPKALQGSPDNLLAVMLAGRELGIGPMAATRMVHIINGQTSIATELKLALAFRAGHDIQALAEGSGWCIAGCASHPEAGCYGWRMGDTDGPDSYPGLTEWTTAAEIMVETWEDAPGGRRKVEAPITAKSNWHSYQRNMLWWRSSSDFMRRHCPGLAGGLYTLEELGGDGEHE